MASETKIRVFIVEDEALIAENLKDTIEDLGYEVAGVAYSYNEALTDISALEFDLLLLDISLGDHNVQTGLDIAKQLPGIKNVPFIFLTAFSDTDTILKAAALHPAGYLVKPVNAPSLFAAIQTAISNFHAHSSASLPGEQMKELDHFYTRAGNKITKVMWEDVYAMVAIKNYVKFLTPQHPSGYLIRSSLQQAHSKFVPTAFRNNFTYISRSTLINPAIIRELKPGIVITPYGEFRTTKSSLKEIMTG